ncbi:MAG: cation:proton antiporter [Candidatus Gracilibacteria bacterium]|nr:cation:proton antiporter [Candidatus Gracilibacteria bacterium]
MGGGIVNTMTFIEGFTSFFSMMVGGAIFGGLIGVFFAKFVGSIKNAEPVEIMLTMILAHITFLLAEFITHFLHNSLHIEYLGISGVVATVIAGIVMGNYGKYKITPKVEHTVEQMWEFFAFVSNSVVFILMGLYLSNIEGINISDFIIPTIITILVVIMARAISVYLPIGFLNKFHLGEKIPLKWQHIMSWGSLRGSLALMMVLMIPGKGDEGFDKILAFQNSVGWEFTYTIKDFILIITIGCIMFTLLIKATTIPLLMRKTKVSELHNFEKFEYYEGNILMLIKVIAKLDSLYQKGAIIKKEYQNLIKKYNNRLDKVIKEFKSFLKEHKGSSEKIIRRAVSLHSLGAEKKFLKEMFLGNEIGEKNFRYILRKIEKQIDRLSSGKEQLRKENKVDYDFFQQIALKAYKERETPSEIFIRNRAKRIIIKRVLIELDELSKLNLGFDKIFEEIRLFYEEVYKKAKNKINKIIEEYPDISLKLDIKLIEKSIFTLEESVIDQMHSKQIISDKLYIKFKGEIEKEFYSDVTENLETFK